MATPLSADRLLAALRAEGVHVVERAGWRTHNRNHKGPWGGVNGIVIHHTAGTNSLGLCVNGTSGLPGPLCHTHLAKNGTATMVGHGRTNHAGTFAANAHAAVVNEATVHPRPDVTESVDGNQHYYGIEIENLGNGRDPYPSVQYDQAVRWAAAICRAHGWSAHSVIGHKEGTRRKIDPSFPMGTFRADVDERLEHPANWSPGSAPPKEDEDPMAGMTPKQIADAVLNTDGVFGVPAAWRKDNPANEEWKFSSVIVNLGDHVRAVEAKLDAQTKTIDELVKAVATLASGLGDLDPAAIVAELTAAIEAIDVRLDVPNA